jgi:hypothetical protein
MEDEEESTLKKEGTLEGAAEEGARHEHNTRRTHADNK